jgi:hypothetical protein
MRIYGQATVAPAPVPLLIYQTLAVGDTLNFRTDPTGTAIVKAGSTVNITRLSVGPTGATGQTGPAGTATNTGATGPSASDALAWTTYSPSWTAGGTNPVIGNGTITGRYKAIGKTVFVSVNKSMGSTTTYGTGAWRISLPVDAYASYSASLPTLFYDTASGGVFYQGTSSTEFNGNTSYVIALWDKGTTYGAAVDSTTPFTWGSSAKLIINGSYESI